MPRARERVIWTHSLSGAAVIGSAAATDAAGAVSTAVTAADKAGVQWHAPAG